jgi:hypothetical protein
VDPVLTANSVVLVEIQKSNDFEPKFTSGDLNEVEQQNVGYPGKCSKQL